MPDFYCSQNWRFGRKLEPWAGSDEFDAPSPRADSCPHHAMEAELVDRYRNDVEKCDAALQHAREQESRASAAVHSREREQDQRAAAFKSSGQPEPSRCDQFPQ